MDAYSSHCPGKFAPQGPKDETTCRSPVTTEDQQPGNRGRPSNLAELALSRSMFHLRPGNLKSIELCRALAFFVPDTLKCWVMLAVARVKHGLDGFEA